MTVAGIRRIISIGMIVTSGMWLGGSGALNADSGTAATATFAGGCFWCMEKPFEELKDEGVLNVVVGYTGGNKDQPTYEEVSSGKTGHKEVVQVTFDPEKINYQKLLQVFWVQVDPYDSTGQFCDKGEQYTSAVYYHDQEQKKAATDSKEKIARSGRLRLDDPIVTEILPAGKFWPAEEYHQDYNRKNPVKYKFYRFSCGRDQRLKQVWGDPAKH